MPEPDFQEIFQQQAISLSVGNAVGLQNPPGGNVLQLQPQAPQAWAQARLLLQRCENGLATGMQR